MPFVKVYIHYVWSTYLRIPFLDSPELRDNIWKHIKQNAKKKGIFVDVVNGHSEHCHCLVSLSVNQSIDKIAQLLKGEVSYWINQNKLTKQKFSWQDEYYAVSVSESAIPIVRNYILRQEVHHRKKTFDEEFRAFLLEHGFESLSGLG